MSLRSRKQLERARQSADFLHLCYSLLCRRGEDWVCMVEQEGDKTSRTHTVVEARTPDAEGVQAVRLLNLEQARKEFDRISKSLTPAAAASAEQVFKLLIQSGGKDPEVPAKLVESLQKAYLEAASRLGSLEALIPFGRRVLIQVKGESIWREKGLARDLVFYITFALIVLLAGLSMRMLPKWLGKSLSTGTGQYVFVDPKFALWMDRFGPEMINRIDGYMAETYHSLAQKSSMPMEQTREIFAGLSPSSDKLGRGPGRIIQLIEARPQDFHVPAAGTQALPYYKIPADPLRLSKLDGLLNALSQETGILIRMFSDGPAHLIAVRGYEVRRLWIEPAEATPDALLATVQIENMDVPSNLAATRMVGPSSTLLADSPAQVALSLRMAAQSCNSARWVEAAQALRRGATPRAPSAQEKARLVGEELARLELQGPFHIVSTMQGSQISFKLTRGRLRLITRKLAHLAPDLMVDLSNVYRLMLQPGTSMKMEARTDFEFENGRRYAWAVRCVDSNGQERWQTGDKGRFVYARQHQTLAPMQLTAPLSGRILREANRNILFQWTSAVPQGHHEIPGLTYTLWLSTSPDFVQHREFTGIQENRFALPDALPDGTYYWRVMAVTAEKACTWAQPLDAHFMVRLTFHNPLVPALLHPALDKSVAPDKVRLVAATAPENADEANPVVYLFEMDRTPTFDSQHYHASPPIKPRKSGVVVWKPDIPLTPGDRWYWRCKATNGILQSPQSPVTWFYVQADMPGQQIALRQPGNDAALTPDDALAWALPAGAPDVRYSLVIDPDRNLFSPQWHRDNLAETSFPAKDLLAELAPNRRYYWTVQAVDPVSGRKILDSPVRSFLIKPSAPVPPEPLQPVFPCSNETLTPGDTTFFWTRSAAGQVATTISYELYLYDADDTSKPLQRIGGLDLPFYTMRYSRQFAIENGEAHIEGKDMRKDYTRLIMPGYLFHVEGDRILTLKNAAAPAAAAAPAEEASSQAPASAPASEADAARK